MTTEEMEHHTTDEELAVYEKIRQRVSKIFGELQERINMETIGQAINKAIFEIKEAKEHSVEAINNASTAFKKDIVSSTKYLQPRVDELTEEARKQFNNWLDKGGAFWHDIVQESEHVQEYSRDKSGAFLSNVLKGLGDWSRSVSEFLDTSLNYKTGETSHGGEFICTNCGGKIHLRHPGRIPPCPKCSKTDFRRS
jgi:chemotaxis regulatin CheY-phosphate phosphatase CheZ/predicted RNA-binding Zn-ribbon protein involved in translation (DUF1610 family)